MRQNELTMRLVWREGVVVVKVDGNDRAKGSREGDGRGSEKGEKARKVCTVQVGNYIRRKQCCGSVPSN